MLNSLDELAQQAEKLREGPVAIHVDTRTYRQVLASADQANPFEPDDMEEGPTITGLDFYRDDFLTEQDMPPPVVGIMVLFKTHDARHEWAKMSDEEKDEALWGLPLFSTPFIEGDSEEYGPQLRYPNRPDGMRVTLLTKPSDDDDDA